MSESHQPQPESLTDSDCHNENENFQDFPESQELPESKPQEGENPQINEEPTEIKKENPEINQNGEQEIFEDVHEKAEVIENVEKPAILENNLENILEESTTEPKPVDQIEIKEPNEFMVEEKIEEELVQSPKPDQTAPVEPEEKKVEIPNEVEPVQTASVEPEDKKVDQTAPVEPEEKKVEIPNEVEPVQTASIEPEEKKVETLIEVSHVEVESIPEVIKVEPNIFEASDIKITESLNEKFLESGPVLINSQEHILEEENRQDRRYSELAIHLTGEISLENSAPLAHEPNIIESQYVPAEKSPELKEEESKNITELKEDEPQTVPELKEEEPKAELELKEEEPKAELEPILIEEKREDVPPPKIFEEKKEESPKKGQPTKEERIEQAKEFKEQGNKFFKEKNFIEAIKSYENALTICHPNFFINSSPALIKEMITLTNILLNNLSYCYFNINDLATSLKFAEQVLLTDPRNTKAHYRKAVAYKKLNDAERSFASIKEARKICIEINDNNLPVFQEYEDIKKNYQEYIAANKEKEKELYSKMISSSKPEIKPENKSDLKINEELKKELNDGEKNEDEDSLQYLWVIPSSLAGMVISWYLKQNLKQGKGVLNTLVLVGFFSGTAVVRNTFVKGLLAISSLAFSAYLYKKSRM